MILICGWNGNNVNLTPMAYASGGGEDGEDTGPKFEYYELNPLVLPVINEAGLAQQISLIVSLEMVEGHAATEIEDYEPRLADAFIQDLYGVLGSGYGLIRNNVLDVQLIKTRLTAVTESVLGPDMVEDVLLQVVQQRPL